MTETRYNSLPMKRLVRWLLDAVAAACLVLCAGVACLWMWSYGGGAQVMYFGSSSGFSVAVDNGSVAFVLENLRWSQPHFEYQSLPPRRGFSFADPFGRPTLWNRLGFYRSQSVRRRGSIRADNLPTPGLTLPALIRFSEFVFPLWLLLLLLAALPFWRFALPLIRRARRSPNHCPQCGYDLRATPDRCPECGTIQKKRGVV
jgi:hypothetical protein